MESNIIYPPVGEAERQQSGNRSSLRSLQPKKQEWAIIYNQQAEEYKQMKILQKQLNKQRMQQFRHDLDKQLNSKSVKQDLEKQEDIKFSQYMKNKIKEEDVKEKNEQLKKLLERRRVEQENYNRHQASKSSRAGWNNKGESGLVIGLKSEEDKIRQRRILKKQLTDTLDKQLKMKQLEKINQKENDSKIEEANKRYISEYYNRRQSIGHKRKQNQDIYNYFQKLNEEKFIKQRQLERKLVDEAIRQKQIQELRKQQDKARQRQQAEREVRKVIEDQLKYKSQQNLNQKKYNPQQNTYGIIGGIFKDKQSNYDKKKYFQFLARQAEQQSLRKKKWDFMSDEQYRLNMNQLNKAVTGTYQHDRYIDRSVNSIGVNKLKGASSLSLDMGNRSRKDDDVIAVQQKLNQLRKNGLERASSNEKSFHL